MQPATAHALSRLAIAAADQFASHLAEVGGGSCANSSYHGERDALPADHENHLAAPEGAFQGRFNGGLKAMISRSPKPIAPYIGGKRLLAPRITSIIDAFPHKNYAEPFVGMGGVFLRRSSQPRAEFINDAGRDVFNLFRVIQEHYVAFLDLMRFQITTQANFERLVATDPETLTDMQRAARFLYLQRTAFGGRVRSPSFGIAKDRPARFNITTLEADIEALHERLAGVTVTCLDFGDFIARVDRKGTLFYLDPPYWGNERDYGDGVFERSDFERMAAQLKRLKGDFLLSLNDRPEVRELFSWAQITPVEVNYTVGSGLTKKAGEVLISSFDIGETHG